jgi:EpsI family protein
MSRRLLTIALVLAAAYGVRVWLDHASAPAFAPHLQRLPRQIGNWSTVRDEYLSLDTLNVLKADDVLMRDYELVPGSRVQLFIAYYRNQRAGESMHSPRNCLPGSGWEQLSMTSLLVDLGNGRQETVSRYLVQKEGAQMLIVYWYQEHDRILADEYGEKLYLMWDSIRGEHRDGAIVRFSVPLRNGLGENQAASQITQFIRVSAAEITKGIFG